MADEFHRHEIPAQVLDSPNMEALAEAAFEDDQEIQVSRVLRPNDVVGIIPLIPSG